MPLPNEAFGPAERIIQTLLAHTDHLYHGRPGLVRAAAGTPTGAAWQPVTHKDEPVDATAPEGAKERVVYALSKVGAKSTRTRIGVMPLDDRLLTAGAPVDVRAGQGHGTVIGTYRRPGLFPEAVAYVYRQVAEVWKLDNEFAARWASYAYGLEHRDLKAVLCAFMLVQSRRGDPVKERQPDGTESVVFRDEDYRDVGEAMMLIYSKDKKSLEPKYLLRVGEILSLPAVAAVNRELGFGRSPRTPFLGRWGKAVTKWLEYREENPKVLEGLVKAGYRSTVMELARRVGYKPSSPRFFDILRWKQKQADDGRRTQAIGTAVAAADDWTKLDERAVCERIMRERPGYKALVGRLGAGQVTRAVMAAAIEAGSLSDKDLIIATPTLEELGLLDVQDVKARWTQAMKSADDMRAANIAKNVRTQSVRETLEAAADTALQKAVVETMKGLRLYLIVDISGSMEGAIEAAKAHLARFVQAFPLDKLHVSVFNTAGREVKIAHPSAAGVVNAFKGINAAGGTDYGQGVHALSGHRPRPDEDVLLVFVGDEGNGKDFDDAVRRSGLNPVAFGLVPVVSARYGRAAHVRQTAARLEIPCFEIDEKTFADPYAVPRTLRALIAATPVGPKAIDRHVAPARVTLVEQILKTDLLVVPAWARPTPTTARA